MLEIVCSPVRPFAGNRRLTSCYGTGFFWVMKFLNECILKIVQFYLPYILSNHSPPNNNALSILFLTLLFEFWIKSKLICFSFWKDFIHFYDFPWNQEADSHLSERLKKVCLLGKLDKLSPRSSPTHFSKTYTIKIRILRGCG